MVLSQFLFWKLRIETIDELKVIGLFHLIGLCFELFKTHPAINSWSYPETAIFKIATVPLYSGFMYASVASYIVQVWRILKIRVINYPSVWITIPLAIAIYAHFFLKYVGLDLKWYLVLTVFIVYFRTNVFFTSYMKERRMPLALGFLLVGFFLWIAENISTFLGAWQYPHQKLSWNVVQESKITAWFLLYIVSFVVVTQLRIFREKKST